ncbi:MAG: alpha/beta fold hydrolase [Gemmatimonadaceae bacterium]
MVEAAYRLATQHLKLPEVHAIVGISLGGLQVFEWGVRYPSYARRLVPIEGNPRQAIYGRAIWELIAKTCEDGLSGKLPMDSTAVILARLSILATTSPAAANRRAASMYDQYLANQVQSLRAVDLHEWAWHARAILAHDVARPFGGDVAQAARRWQARTLVVTALHDHSIDPQPAHDFARLIGADTLVIASSAGHSAIFSDSAAKSAVRTFLSK